ncbi:hypothetical protein LguiA_021123 [Lonicera macranthoides]
MASSLYATIAPLPVLLHGATVTVLLFTSPPQAPLLGDSVAEWLIQSESKFDRRYDETSAERK